MLRKICRQMRHGPVNKSKILPVYVIDDVIRAIVQTAQLQRTLPVRRVKRVIHLLVLADDVRLGQIESNVVKRAQILPASEILLLVKLEPLGEALLAFRSEVEPPVLLDQRRQNELRADAPSNSYRG